MERRHFLGSSFAAAQTGQIPLPPANEKVASGTGAVSYKVDVTIERKQSGKPHKGKMLAAIQPHCDDIPIFAGGTVLKLIDEGYEGILITMSDDSMAGDGSGYGEVVWKNEKDTREVAKRLGLKESIFLNYSNHNMDAWPIIEMRARLVFLFRYFKVDTILVYDPSGLYERNPDHYVAAKAVEWAAGICAMKWDYPEFEYAGVKPHAVRERYYFARGPQLVNRVVDIKDYIDQKVHVNNANITQGPAGDTGARLRQRLAAQGKRLPLLGNDDETANRQYTKYFALARDRARGPAYGLEWAEYYHYIGPDESEEAAYIAQNAVPL
ncbi:MAG: PIG-L family deacetylase [Bryobacteraceae bacterium]|nr:PIG-L family deacetylase [Bryobacteraceae bacterium]